MGGTTGATSYESETASIDWWCYGDGECHCWQIIHCYESNDCSGDSDRKSKGACATVKYDNATKCAYGGANIRVTCSQWCAELPGECWTSGCTTAEDC